MKSKLTFLKSAVAMFAVFALAVAQTPDVRWFTGAGAEADTFKISTVEELAGLAQLVNRGNDFKGKTVVLVNDIDLTEWDNWRQIGGYVDIVEGDTAAREPPFFSGTFDGEGKIVKGLHYGYDSRLYLGLFGYVLNGAVKNVGVVDMSLSGDKNVGGVVGRLVGGVVENCYSSGYMNTGGGVVGAVDGGRVSGCYSSVRILNGSSGGVVGRLVGGGHVVSCYSTGDIGHMPSVSGMGQVSSEPSSVGGVVGIVEDGVVANCYSTGTIRGSWNIGGVVGVIGSGSVVSGCVALNPEVSQHGYDGPGGRVVSPGYGATGSLVGNYAFSAMTGYFPDIKGETSVNGTDITADEILSDSGVLSELFKEENGWTREKGKLPGLLGKPVDIPDHLYNPDAVASHDREIPTVDPKKEEAVVVIAPLNKSAAEFIAGPNPVGKQARAVNFYFQGNRIKSGELTVYDASGNVVGTVKAEDRKSAASVSAQGYRRIGSWDLKDKKGRPVPEGTYLAKGAVTVSSGKSVKVSATVAVR